jgi:hypothetical protein
MCEYQHWCFCIIFKRNLFSDLFCGPRTCRFEIYLFHHIYVEGVTTYFVGQLDNSRFYISKDWNKLDDFISDVKCSAALKITEEPGIVYGTCFITCFTGFINQMEIIICYGMTCVLEEYTFIFLGDECPFRDK